MAAVLNTIYSNGESTNRHANPASDSTIAANYKCLSQLPFSDTRDFENATHGFMGTLESGIILKEDGSEVWNLKQYEFLDEPSAPDTVNPSLWRQARLNCINGLFQVTDRIYQVRMF